MWANLQIIIENTTFFIYKSLENNERAFLSRSKRDRNKDPFVIKMREMLRKSGLR